MSELAQIFIDLFGLKVGWGGTCLKGWGLKAMIKKRDFYLKSLSQHKKSESTQTSWPLFPIPHP